MDHLIFEIGIALLLVAVAALISSRLKISVVPFLIIIGMLVGDHAPKIGMIDLTFKESAEYISFMGRMGVLFLLFYLGLEFSVSRLIKMGGTIASSGGLYITVNFILGLLYAYFQGWNFLEVLVAAGITTISSSAIVAKVIVDTKRAANPETELVLGITMFEDVFLAIYLSLVSGLILSGGASALTILLTAGKAFVFIFGFIFLGRLAVPFLNKALRITSNEAFIIVLFCTLFLIAGFAETIKVSEAIGALLIGLVLAETEHMERIEHLIVPFRDFFGGMFFFSFGLSIVPAHLLGAVWIALGAVVLTIIGNVTTGYVSGKRAGLSTLASLNIGFTILARGEFSIIIAQLGKAGNLDPILQTFAALYVLLLSIIGPILSVKSDVVYNFFQKIFGNNKPQKMTDA